MKKLLSESNDQQLQICHYILSSPKQSRSSKEIQDALNLSEHIVKTRCDALIADIQQIAETPMHCLLEYAFNQYKISGSSGDIINRLLLKYGKKSRIFQLLHMIVTKSYVAISNYQDIAFVGESNAYNMKDNLKDFLSDYGLSIGKKNQLIGEEYVIRQLLYSIYYTIFKNLEIPFESYIENEAQQIFNQLLKEELCSFELSEADKNKLLTYLMITVLRINHQYFLHEKNKYFPSERRFTQTIQFIQKRFKLSNERANLEWQLIKSFLEIEKIIPYANTIYRQETTQKINNAAEGLLKYLEQYRIDRSNKQTLELIDFGFRNMFKMVFLSASKRVDSLFYLRETDVSEGDSFHLKICHAFMHSYIQEEGEVYQCLLKNHLLMRDLTISLERILLESGLRYEVSIRLDFSMGPSYQEYIKKWIQRSLDIPITIVENSKEKANILVTDYLTKSRNEERLLIWSKPSTPNDWKALKEWIREELSNP